MRDVCRFAILCSFFACSTIIVSAQQTDTGIVANVPGSIERIDGQLNVKLAVTNDIETFDVKTGTDKFVIAPHTSVITHLFVNYRVVSFAISYTPRFIPGNVDDSIRGKTKNLGFSFGFNINKVYNDLSFSQTRGFYLQNTADYVPQWKKGNAFVQFPNLVVSSFEGSTGYKFNPQFSQRALTSQTERQVKSAGSFIPKLYYRYYIIDDMAGVSAQKTNNLMFVLGAGYHYTFVTKKCFYLSLGLTPGLGFVSSWMTTRSVAGDVYDNKQGAVLLLDGSSAIGYNGRRIFAGMWVTSSYLKYHERHTSAVNTDDNIYYQVFLGYRFNAPKLVKKTYDGVVEKMNKHGWSGNSKRNSK